MENREVADRNERLLTDDDLDASWGCCFAGSAAEAGFVLSSFIPAKGFKVFRLIVGRLGTHREKPCGSGGVGAAVDAAIVARVSHNNSQIRSRDKSWVEEGCRNERPE